MGYSVKYREEILKSIERRFDKYINKNIQPKVKSFLQDKYNEIIQLQKEEIEKLSNIINSNLHKKVESFYEKLYLIEERLKVLENKW